MLSFAAPGGNPSILPLYRAESFVPIIPYKKIGGFAALVSDI
jgi:hypothetical protein